MQLFNLKNNKVKFFDELIQIISDFFICRNQNNYSSYSNKAIHLYLKKALSQKLLKNIFFQKNQLFISNEYMNSSIIKNYPFINIDKTKSFLNLAKYHLQTKITKTFNKIKGF